MGPLPDQTEAKGKFTPLSGGRSHIVAPLKDHLKPEGNFEKTSEIQAQYRNLSPSRPVIHKLKDTLKPQGEFANASETVVAYKDNHATRPVIHKLKDHGVDVQPEGNISKTSEYNTIVVLILVVVVISPYHHQIENQKNITLRCTNYTYFLYNMYAICIIIKCV